MSDVFLFIQQGWRNIWRQKSIWLFSVLPVVSQIILPTYDRGEQNIAMLCLYLVVTVLAIVVWDVSVIGVPYQAFTFTIGRSATIQETLAAVRRFSWRIVGCSALGIFLLLPCLFLGIGIALNNSIQPSQVSNMLILVFLPLSIFSCLWSFAVFGFFENEWGIRTSLANAWGLFTSHFGALALLGILVVGIWQTGSVIAGMLSIVLQSGSNTASLSNLNYLNPSTTLGSDPLFVLINGVNQAIYNSLSASIFVLAYLKYRGEKVLSIPKSG